MNYKYLILDFGKVLVYSNGMNWDITSKFLELIDINTFDMEKFKTLRNKYGHILSEQILTLEEEYNMFFKFYNGILSELDYKEEIAKEIAYDRTYNNDKYIVYDNVYNELERLKEKYTLILLTDNWPCATNYLKKHNLEKYFNKIYISSIYGVEKKDKVFFDYPINDFNIKPGEALFIDDNETNLDCAKEKGLDVLLMDREKEVEKSKYKIINNLEGI